MRMTIANKKKINDIATVMEFLNDVIHIQHVLLINKVSSACFYFWNNKFDSEHFANLETVLNIVLEFGNNINTQLAINKINFGNNCNVIIADGSYFRIAVSQSKKSSLIFRYKLLTLLKIIETEFKVIQNDFSIDFKNFNKLESMFQNQLHLSLLLAHKINYNYENLDNLLKYDSKNVINVVNSLVQEYKSPFFFIPILIQSISQRTDLRHEQILEALLELQKLQVIQPIKIQNNSSSLTKKQLELLHNLENLDNFFNAQKFATFMESRTPIEREIYLYTLIRNRKIDSPPIKADEVAIRIKNVKLARKTLEDQKKKIKSAFNKKDFEIVKILCNDAIKIAFYWNLGDNLKHFINMKRLVKIQENIKKLNQIKAKAESALNAGHKSQASHYFSLASEVANVLYNLGYLEIYDELCILSKQKSNL